MYMYYLRNSLYNTCSFLILFQRMITNPGSVCSALCLANWGEESEGKNNRSIADDANKLFLD